MVAAACSSSGDDDATDESTETTAADTSADESGDEGTEADGEGDESADEDAAASSEPILVMVTGTIESPAFGVPSAPLGAQIAIDEVNAAGGIDGRPLELLVCNDELDPSIATGCVQTAVQEGAVALVGGLSVFEAPLVPLLEAEGIAWVANTLADVSASPNLFPVGADGVTAFVGIGAASILRGCESPAIVVSASSTPNNTGDLRAGIEAYGGTVAGEFQATGPDFAPIVESAIAEGADCIASGVSPVELPGLLSAVAGRLPITTVDGSLPQPLLDGLGEAANGIHAVSGFLLPGSGDPRVLALEEASLAVAPDVGLDQFWFTGYIGVKLVAEALTGADEVSAAATLEAMSTISGFDTGVGPILDFTTPNPIASVSQLFNTELYLWEIQGGAYTLLQDETVDMQPGIDLMTGR